MKIIFCLIKGRNLKESLFLFKKFNISFNRFSKKRKLYIKTNKKNIYFLLVKNNDFKYYLKNCFLDLIIIGNDMIINYYFNYFYNYKIIKINFFFLSIICNKYYRFSKNSFLFKTKYYKILKNYLCYKNIKNIKIGLVKGSLENICLLKEDNLIFDIVSTGLTIKVNNIFELKKIILLKSYILFNKNIIYNKIFLQMEKFLC